MSAEEQFALLAKAAQIAKDGSTERYKVSHHFGGTIHNPKFLTES